MANDSDLVVREDLVKTPRCFLALPYTTVSPAVRRTIETSVDRAGFEVVSPDRLAVRPASTIQEIVIGEIARADCVIADMSGRNPNVFLEVGLAQAMGKALFLLIDESTTDQLPTDLRGYQFLSYQASRSGLTELGIRLRNALTDYRRSPRVTGPMVGASFSRPFFVDWDRLDRSDAENLVRELLSQLGYRRIDWEKESKEIDLVAELPKKDPDGFEYRELWFVTMGRNAPVEMVLEMVSMDPEYLLYRSLGDVERRERFISQSFDAPITLLVIDWKGEQHLARWDKFRLRSPKRHGGGNIRVRVWDKSYLTALVQQFPLLGYKYFSDEARSRLKYRKTYEDLYKENVTLTTRLTKTLAALEQEKNKRVRAERDAIWKDISFSAAHKIGNPVFAIETNLDPLQKRIVEQRVPEAKIVLTKIRDSVEKAKTIIDQFKSLTRAQQIAPVSMRLRPVLEDACRMVESEEIKCEIDCEPSMTIYGDPDRLAESFDELVRNSTHWFDKPSKEIRIEVVQPAEPPFPESLDTTKQYTLIRFSDNGAGVPLEIKQKIFDAFFTKRDHGTGLGLALVRRVIEGHGGLILEDGIPSQGTRFEIYLPMLSEILQNASDSAPKPKRRKKGKKTNG